jgi:hypothetical protein
MGRTVYHRYIDENDYEEEEASPITEATLSELNRANRALAKNTRNYVRLTREVKRYAKSHPDKGIPLDLILDQGSAYMAMITMGYEVERIVNSAQEDS